MNATLANDIQAVVGVTGLFLLYRYLLRRFDK